jgi:hypothetical protein
MPPKWLDKLESGTRPAEALSEGGLFFWRAPFYHPETALQVKSA